MQRHAVQHLSAGPRAPPSSRLGYRPTSDNFGTGRDHELEEEFETLQGIPDLLAPLTQATQKQTPVALSRHSNVNWSSAAP